MRSCLAPSALVLVLAGCDPVAPPIPTDSGPRVDAPRDGSSDAPIDAPIADGDLPDVMPMDGGMLSCSVAEADRLALGSDLRMRDRSVALAAGATTWGVAWFQSVAGLDEIHVAVVPVDGDPMIRQHTSFGAIARDPAIVHTSGGWVLAWVDNHLDSNFEVYAQALGEDAEPSGTASRLTTNADADQTPALVGLPTGDVLAAWVQAGLTDNLAFTRALAPTSAPRGAARMATTMDSSVERPSLAYRSAGAVMAWGEGGASPPAVRVLALDAVGGPSGTPASASTEGNIDGSADLTMDAFGGAVVFGALVGGVNPEVRIRLLDETGTPIESERVVIPGGKDASVAPLGGGYVVSYRSTGATPFIRLAFLDAQGVFLNEIDVAPAAASGGRTAVRVTDEGRILVTWADVEAGTRIFAARVRCE